MFKIDDEVVDDVIFPGYTGKVVKTKDLFIDNKFPVIVDVVENSKVTKRFYYTEDGRININSKITLFKNTIYHKMIRSNNLLNIVTFSITVISFFILLSIFIKIMT